MNILRFADDIDLTTTDEEEANTYFILMLAGINMLRQ